MSSQSDDDAYVAPRTFLERELCSMWIELTANDDIGITDRFLDVGGHSLLASKVVARVRESYSVRIPLRWCIEHPTVSALAELIQATQANEESRDAADSAERNGGARSDHAGAGLQ